MRLAVDLGATSGRVVRGEVRDERLHMEELRRFPNAPVELDGRLVWDIEHLLDEVGSGIDAAGEVASIGITGWGVDFALLRPDGSLAAPPRAYRDALTEGIVPRLYERIAPDRLYELTGIQVMEINTICQLLALRLAEAPELEEADLFMLLPDYLLYRLGAEPVAERTNASTTQLLRAGGGWEPELLAAVGVDPAILPPLVPAGAKVGRLGRADLLSVATHDTAAAVMAVPFEPGVRAAFISCGTWSLVGLELAAPLLSAKAQAYNLSNEEGFGGTTRLLRNVTGLWLVDRCLEAWGLEPASGMALAEAAGPAGRGFNVDDPALQHSADTPAAIAQLCGVDANDRGTLLRAVYEGIARRYRVVLDELREVTGQGVERIHLVGGGAKNRLLCQLAADALELPVHAGPVEASAIGALATQLIAAGELGGLKDARRLVRASFEVRVYEPSKVTVGG
ncbi:MAG TPA: FGGY-family carbohydrate kinase [Candidatus Dormibacteraeota bacterium]